MLQRAAIRTAARAPRQAAAPAPRPSAAPPAPAPQFSVGSLPGSGVLQPMLARTPKPKLRPNSMQKRVTFTGPSPVLTSSFKPPFVSPFLAPKATRPVKKKVFVPPPKKLIPRKEVELYGPDVGFFRSSKAKSLSRAIANTPPVVTSIDQTGYTSGATRQGLPVNAAPVTDEEIAEYSGVKGRKPSFRASRLVGANKDTRHTLDVASGTSGHKDLSSFLKRRGPDDVMRLDEIIPGLVPGLMSVHGAFKRTGLPNRYPVKGEYVSSGTILPSAFGHTSIFPLSHPLQQEGLGQEGQVHPNYLRNLALATGASLDNPLTFDVRHKTRQAKGQKITIDRFLEPKPQGDGRAEKARARLRRKLEAKNAAKTTTE